MTRFSITLFLVFCMVGLSFSQSSSWRSYATEDFNYYYSTDLQEQAKAVNFKFKNELFDLQNLLNYHLNDKVDVFLVSNWMEKEDLTQDMLMGVDNAAGLISSLTNGIVLDLSEDPATLLSSFKSQVSLVIFNEMMYGGSLQDQMRSANLIYFPDWFVSGLIHYLGRGWDLETDNAWRAVFELYGIDRFNSIPQKYNALKGAAFAKYLQDKYGQDAISNLLYMSRLTRKLNSGLYYSFQSKARDVFREMIEHYSVAYTKDQRKRIPIQGQSLDPDKLLDLLVIDSESFYALRKTSRGICFEHWANDERQEVIYTLGVSERPLKRFSNSIQMHNGDLVLLYKNSAGVVVRNHSTSKEHFVKPSSNVCKVKSVGGELYLLSSGLLESILYAFDGNNLQARQRFDGYINDLAWDDKQLITSRMYLDSVYVIQRYKDEQTELLCTDAQVRDLVLRQSDLFFNWGKNGVLNAARMNVESGDYVFLTDYRANIAHQQMNDSLLAEYVERLDGSALFITSLDASDFEFNYDSITPVYFKSFVQDIDESFVPPEYNPNLDSLPDYTYQSPFPKDKDFRLSNYDSLKAEADKLYSESGRVADAENFFRSNTVFVQIYNELNGINELPFASSLEEYIPRTFGIRLGSSILNQFNNQTLRGSYYGFRLLNYERDVNLQYWNKKNRFPFMLQVFHRQRLSFVNELDAFKDRTHLGELRWTWFQRGGWTFENSWQYRQDEQISLSTDQQSLEGAPSMRSRLSSSFNLIFDNTPFLYRGWNTRIETAVMPYYMTSKNSLNLSLRIKATAERQFSPWLQLKFIARGGVSTGENPEYFVLGGTSSDLLSNLYPRNFSPGKQASYYNMIYGIRGFDVNYRNGTTFGVSTMQLSWQPLQHMSKRPLFSALLNSISLVGFGDIATSFYGSTYTDPSNALNSNYFTTPGQSFDILVKNVKNPLIGALGFGLHGKLYSYDLALDWAYGIESGSVRQPMLHLSLSKYLE